jgi:hypothetical protein
MKTSMITLLLACVTLFSVAQSIIQAEYFIDVDKGFGKNNLLSLKPFTDSNYTLHINLTNVTPGFHRLYVRTKSSNNRWSLTVRKTIEVFPSQSFPKFTKGEYFIDTDPGTGKAKAITVSTADSAITQTFTASTTGLSPGYHRLYIRTRDSEGRWSLTARRIIEIAKSLDTAKITAAEYFFSSDPGFGKATTKTFATPSANGTFTFNIPYSSIPTGADTLFVRIVDTDKKWSLTKRAKFSGSPASTLNTFTIISEARTNKSSLMQFNVTVNPNPIKDNVLNLNIQHAKSANLQLTVYSMDGKRVLSQQFDITKSTSKQISIHRLSVGTYNLQLSDGLEVRSIKFIKE